MDYEYALQRVKGIKKSFDNAAMLKINEYADNRIFDLYQTMEDFEIFTSTEGMSGSKQLSDLETPPLLSLNDGYSISVAENRWGAGIELSEREYKRLANDATMKVDAALIRKRNALLVDVSHTFLTEVFKFLNQAFSSSSSYLAPDGVEICGTHSWATSGASSFSNAATAILSATAVDTAVEWGSDFKDASGKPLPISFDTIIVKKGSANAREAKRLFASNISPIAVADINIYQGEFMIIETPYITTANKNYWFMKDSMHATGNPLKVGVGLYPQLDEPIKQNNEAIRTNCTGFFKMAVANLPFSIYGSTGAA